MAGPGHFQYARVSLGPLEDWLLLALRSVDLRVELGESFVVTSNFAYVEKRPPLEG